AERKPAYGGFGPVVSLDKDYSRLLPDFDKRFPSGPPSLRHCRRLRVDGDVTFGAHVTVDGEVDLTGPRHIDDGEGLGNGLARARALVGVRAGSSGSRMSRPGPAGGPGAAGARCCGRSAASRGR